jgi:hypothetical protein
MGHVAVFYQLTKDGAPLRVIPVGNVSGEWLVICKCCGRDFTESTRERAFDLAHVHTLLASEFWNCASGKAASVRATHRNKREATT